MRLKLRQFFTDMAGTTTLEYGLIAAGLSVAIITLAGQLGDEIRVMFEHLRDMLLSFNIRFAA